MNRLLTAFLRTSCLLALSIGVSGCCAPLNIRGDGFPADHTFDSTAAVRKSESTELFGLSNKARKVERNLGAD
jgi:hypothetical protein